MVPWLCDKRDDAQRVRSLLGLMDRALDQCGEIAKAGRPNRPEWRNLLLPSRPLQGVDLSLIGDLTLSWDEEIPSLGGWGQTELSTGLNWQTAITGLLKLYPQLF